MRPTVLLKKQTLEHFFYAYFIVTLCRNMKLLKPYVIRTEINTFVPFATQRAGGVLFKILKYFEVMLNIFELSSGYNFSPGDWSMQINSYGLPNRIS